jgi:Predicted membrane protein (DUF2207)
VPAVLDLTGRDVDLALLGLAAGALWLAGAAFMYARRHPAEPSVGPRTLDLGPEPPAVANFLVSDFKVTPDAIPATLIDLAARRIVEVEQRGPGVFYIRLRTDPRGPLTAYEQRVLAHLRKVASDGVVPAEALTTGTEDESGRWRKAFAGEVVADAKARGLSRDAFGELELTLLGGAAVVPAVAVIPAGGWEAALTVMAVAVAIVGWIRSRFPQRETPAGLEAASRWLGVRAELAENEVFESYSPLTVPLWDRLLAYGAAMGVASGASGPLPMGAESDTHAWSSHGGRWRPVRVSYPRLWPPGWGLEPVAALVGGAVVAVAGGLALNSQGERLAESAREGWSDVVSMATLAVLCAAVLLGVAVAAMAFRDQWASIEVTGPVLRLRALGGDDPRYYVAVDDGSSREIRAWRVSRRQYWGMKQGQIVTVAATRNLGRVRSIVDEHGSPVFHPFH